MRLLVGARQLQKFLKNEGHYRGPIDGLFGRKSQAASVDLVRASQRTSISLWNIERLVIAAQQLLFKSHGISVGTIDGYVGPNTYYAQELYQNLLRDIEPEDDETKATSTIFPKYAQIEQFYGPAGEANLKRFTAPYPLPLAWDTNSKRKSLRMNKLCGASAIGVLEAVRDHYGMDAIRELRLDLFGGDFNNRPMRGGSRKSTHAYGVALDFDPEHNAYRWTDARASFDEDPYEKWWELWEEAGWVSLGRERNFDWMHIQAVRL